MVQQGTAMLSTTQIQNVNVYVPKLSYRKTGRLRSVMSSVTHCDG